MEDRKHFLSMYRGTGAAFFILALVFIFCFVACGDPQETTQIPAVLADLAGNGEIYVAENGVYTAFLVLTDDYHGNTLLLRKQIMPQGRRFSDYGASYPESLIDQYLSGSYLKLLEPKLAEKLVDTSIEATAEEALYSAGKQTQSITRRVFLLSYTEVGYSEHAMAPEEGIRLPGFTDDRSRVACRGSVPCSWWLRTAYTNYDSVVWTVGGDGEKSELSADYENGVRPAFCLPGDTVITEKVIDGKRVYVIE